MTSSDQISGTNVAAFVLFTIEPELPGYATLDSAMMCFL
jgi:hypothetical protein